MDVLEHSGLAGWGGGNRTGVPGLQSKNDDEDNIWNKIPWIELRKTLIPSISPRQPPAVVVGQLRVKSRKEEEEESERDSD